MVGAPGENLAVVLLCELDQGHRRLYLVRALELSRAFQIEVGEIEVPHFVQLRLRVQGDGTVRGDRLLELPARVQPKGARKPAAERVPLRHEGDVASGQHRVDPLFVEQQVGVDGENRQYRDERIDGPSGAQVGRRRNAAAASEPGARASSRYHEERSRSFAATSSERPANATTRQIADRSRRPMVSW